MVKRSARPLAKDVLRANVRELMEVGAVPSEAALARLVHLDQKTINSFLRADHDSAVRLATLEAFARWAGVPAWAMLVPVPSARVLRRLARLVEVVAELPAEEVEAFVTRAVTAARTGAAVRRRKPLVHRSLAH